jgi:BRCT domain type II-containing protein
MVPALSGRPALKFGTLKGKAFVAPGALESLTDDEADAFIEGREAR